VGAGLIYEMLPAEPFIPGIMKQMDSSTPVGLDKLHQEVRRLIETARTRVVSQVNQALVLTYWHVGNTIRTRVLMDDRAGYGDETIKRLAERLVQEFGSGFGQRNLFRMVKFTQQFFDMEILSTLSTKLSWSHFVEVFKIDDPLKREFYVGMCASEGWSVRMLRQSMDSMLYERTAISRQPEMVVRRELDDLRQNRKASPQLFLRDPYLLNFLDLADDFTEKDLENAILMDLERFILEIGTDFAFMGRQRRIQIGGNDYYIDLLFYHRKLRRLVLIELKIGDFKPEYKGQVELYLKWLERYEKQPEEETPIAIILCAGKDDEVVELMDLHQDNVHVAEYWIQLPPKEVLKNKLHKAMVEARARLELAGNTPELPYE